MALTIGATPFACWACLQDLMEHLGWRNRRPLLNATELAGTESNGPRLEHSIAQTLDQGQSFERASNSWRTETQHLLNFFRAHRGQSTMVDILAAVHPDELVKRLAQHNSALVELAKPYSGSLEQVPRPNDLSLLLATQLVAQTIELIPLLAHLEAGSVPFGGYRYGVPSIDVKNVTEQLATATGGRHSIQLNDHQKRLAGLLTARAQTEDIFRNENELLITQLHKAQQDLEACYQTHRNGSETSEKMGVTIYDWDKKLKLLHNEIPNGNESSRACSQVMEAEVQGAPAKTQLGSTAEETGFRALREDIQRLTNNLQQMGGAKATADDTENNLKEEIDLILRQLFQVQEELEKHYLKSRKQGERREKQSTELEKRRTELKTGDVEIKKIRQNGEREVAKQLVRNKRLKLRQVEVKETITKLQTENSSLKKHTRVLSTSLKELNLQRKGFKLMSLFAGLKRVSRASRERPNNIHLIQASDLFDKAWYLNQNSDVKAQSVDPVVHYVKYGGLEGRAESTRFDSKLCLNKHLDVANQGQIPLVHYPCHGKAEGRKV